MVAASAAQAAGCPPVAPNGRVRQDRPRDSLMARKPRFWLLGLCLFGADLAVFASLHHYGFALSLAHMAGFFIAVILCAVGGVMGLRRLDRTDLTSRLARWVAVLLLILFLRGGILASLLEVLNLPPGWSIFLSVLASSVLLVIGQSLSGFPSQSEPYSRSLTDRLLFGSLLYSVLLRLAYLGSTELFYEEAYYWNYAQHLDIGYLDHPPLVAWIIGLFTWLMGDTEFAVRFGAFVCWLITAWFIFRLTRRACYGSSEWATVLLAAILPAYFATGLVMTPDAPLVACWAAAVYFLYRALIDEQRAAWWGVGVAAGLGMLAKYTFALLGLAALFFLLADRRSRKWFLRPDPYWAIGVALALFSPVIIWNAEHGWLSFAFQSAGRMAEQATFDLPYFIGSIILLLTPTGLLTAVLVVWYRRLMATEGGPVSADARGYYLLITLTLLPVAVFAALSLTRETKFHWTAPCWLGILAYMAVIVRGHLSTAMPRIVDWCQRAWPATMVICLLCYGIVLHYLALGLPGVPYPQNFHLLGWQDFGRQIEEIVKDYERKTGESLIVVGMDRNKIASGVAFYRARAVAATDPLAARRSSMQTSSQHLFGGNSLMYEYWLPANELQGKTLLLIAKDPAELAGDHVRTRAQEIGDIREIVIWKHGVRAGRYYYGLVRGYQRETTR